MMKKLGYGTGVSVYLLPRSPRQGHYCSPWAVKKVNRSYLHKPQANFRVEQEARVLRQLAHPNLIGFRGLKRLDDGNVALLLEKGGRSLMDLIDERPADQGAFPPEAIIRTGHALAKGLSYMHKQGILHGDVKSGNVLVPDGPNWGGAKLCDLGTALELDENMLPKDPESEYIGTEAWTAREILDDNFISDKADIYALGMLLYEMLSLCVPHMADLDEDTSWSDEDWMVKLGKRPELPAQVLNDPAYNRIVELYYICSEDSPQRRPSAEKLVSVFEEFLLPTCSQE